MCIKVSCLTYNGVKQVKKKKQEKRVATIEREEKEIRQMVAYHRKGRKRTREDYEIMDGWLG